jgi:hypothetical protein
MPIAYNIEEAEKKYRQGADPLTLSIEKWENIREVLGALVNEAGNKCGLCFVYIDLGCQGCIIRPENLDKVGGCIELQYKAILDAFVAADEMVHTLRKLKEEGDPREQPSL